MTVADTREKILDAAESLFFHDGIAITGVDRVAGTAGVSVVTLYKHMGSKDGMLTEVLQRRLERWDAIWQEQIDATQDPRLKVLALFDAVDAFRQRPQSAQWCSFLATASERPDQEDQPAQLVVADTELLVQRLGPLAENIDPQNAQKIVETTILLYNGVLSSLLRGQPRDAVAHARSTACRALDWKDLLLTDA